MLLDFFMFVAEHWTFSDFMAVFCQSPEPIERIHPDIRNFVISRMLNNESPTPENIISATARIIEQHESLVRSLSVCLPSLPSPFVNRIFARSHLFVANTQFQNEVISRSDIDFYNTVNAFLTRRVYDLITLALVPEGWLCSSYLCNVELRKVR